MGKSKKAARAALVIADDRDLISVEFAGVVYDVRPPTMSLMAALYRFYEDAKNDEGSGLDRLDQMERLAARATNALFSREDAAEVRERIENFEVDSLDVFKLAAQVREFADEQEGADADGDDDLPPTQSSDSSDSD